MLEAQKRKHAKIISVQREGRELLCLTENGLLLIEPISEAIIRIRYTLEETFRDVKSLGVSILETGFCPAVRWSYTQTDNHITLTTNQIIVKILKLTSAITFYDKTGSLLVKEPDQGGKHLIAFESYKTLIDEESIIEKIVTPDGIKEVIKDAKKLYDRRLYHTRLEFEWADDEAIYGFGQQEEGTLNLRGTRQYIHQANMKIAMPMMISTKHYGILMDTYSPLIFSDNEYGSYIYNEAADQLDYYFIYGETIDRIIHGYRLLSGKATMLPKWTFGYMQSQERYESQQEIMDIVLEYRRRELPLDSIVLDWLSWEEGLWGQKTYDKSRFPDPLAMTQWLHQEGVHFMISIWPTMNEHSDNYKEMKEGDCLYQNSGIYNAFDEKARNLYWKQANEGLFAFGTDAWWCDSSEPVTPEWNMAIKPEPDQNYAEFHQSSKVYMDEAHTNAYPLMHAKTMYEGQRQVTSDKRVVNLTRSGYTGIQKYGTILWSGDTSANWKTLRNQIVAGLNLCASGLPYWTLDIGGFFVKQGHMWFWDGDYEEGCTDLGYRELYTRWFQLGAFLPIFRAHGTDTRREIWQFGEKGTLFYDVLAKFNRLRYKLLPYIYSMAGQVYLEDYTIMRLLAFDFNHDPEVFSINDQYMFGESIMVCPVTKPMYYKAGSREVENRDKVRQVYLPRAATWIDYWTNEVYSGGSYIQVAAPLEIMPLFIKAGSIIPMADVAQSSEQSSDKAINLCIYPGADGRFSFYQDEKDTYNYEEGAYSLIDMEWKDNISTLTIHSRVGTFTDMEKVIEFDIYILDELARKITYDGNRCVVTI